MRDSIKTGLLVGIAAALYLGLLAIVGDHGGSSLKYCKYLILIVGLYFYFSGRMKSWTYDKFIANFIGSVTQIVLVASGVIVIANTFLFFLNPEFSIQKYTLLPDSLAQLLIIDGIILIETVVVGLLTSFVIFPYFKNKFLDDKGIQQPEGGTFAQDSIG